MGDAAGLSSTSLSNTALLVERGGRGTERRLSASSTASRRMSMSSNDQSVSSSLLGATASSAGKVRALRCPPLPHGHSTARSRPR